MLHLSEGFEGLKKKIVDVIVPQGVERKDSAGKHQSDRHFLPETALACKQDNNQENRCSAQDIKRIPYKNNHAAEQRTSQKQQKTAALLLGNFNHV